MAKVAMRRSPVADRVSANLRQLRRDAGLDQGELSRRLDKIGHPIPSDSISLLEKGKRRADVGDLVALASVLGVSPNRLLLTATAGGEKVALAENLSVDERAAWFWASGDRQLPGEDGRVFGDAPFEETNRPHDPPDRATLRDLELYQEQLDGVLDGVQSLAVELGVPSGRILTMAQALQRFRRDR